MKSKKRKLQNNEKKSPRHTGVTADCDDISLPKAKIKDTYYLSSIFPSEEIMRIVEAIILKEQFAEESQDRN